MIKGCPTNHLQNAENFRFMNPHSQFRWARIFTTTICDICFCIFPVIFSRTDMAGGIWLGLQKSHVALKKCIDSLSRGEFYKVYEKKHQHQDFLKVIHRRYPFGPRLDELLEDVMQRRKCLPRFFEVPWICRRYLRLAFSAKQAI